jgi:hypothetical protein
LIKIQEITDRTSCLLRADLHEMIFVLRAKDVAAPEAIRAWVRERIRLGKNTDGDEQTTEALECASFMEDQRANGIKSQLTKI